MKPYVHNFYLPFKMNQHLNELPSHYKIYVPVSGLRLELVSSKAALDRYTKFVVHSTVKRDIWKYTDPAERNASLKYKV